MIFGIGIDTIEVERIKKAIEQYGAQFSDRIYSQSEQEYCRSRLRQYEHFAARFAAKEAFAKALGTGIRNGFRWKEVIVRNAMTGKPAIVLSGSMIEHTRDIVAANAIISLSLTHTSELAEAIVTIER